MTERIQQVKTVTDTDTNTGTGIATETTRTVADSTTAAEQPASYTAARVIWFIAGVIIVLLAIRFAFVLLGANQGNGFVNFIYSVSHPFAAPFFGIFGYSIDYGVSRVELSSLVAMAIYALVAWGLAKLVTIRHPQQ